MVVSSTHACNITLRFVLADMIQKGFRFIPEVQLAPLSMEEPQQMLPVPSAAVDSTRPNGTIDLFSSSFRLPMKTQTQMSITNATTIHRGKVTAGGSKMTKLLATVWASLAPC